MKFTLIFLSSLFCVELTKEIYATLDLFEPCGVESFAFNNYIESHLYSFIAYRYLVESNCDP